MDHRGNQDQPDEDQEGEQMIEDIDFRTLLTNSKYDQIERHLLKMFSNRKRDRSKRKSCSHHHNHSLERFLFDIEEDLHKILLILLKQLEMFSGKVAQNNRQSMIQEFADESHHQLSDQRKIEKDFRQESAQLLNRVSVNLKPVVEKADMDHSRTIEGSDSKDIQVESEYSKLCSERDENFRRKIERIQSQTARSIGNYHHYHLNKPDIEFILGGSSTDASKSHSKLVTNQIRLAQLKQHNPLCTKIGELQRIASDGKTDGTNHARQIVEQIQSMIEELHLEHDWISKKLYHYQQQNQVLLSQNETLSQMADKVNLKNMFTLSEHLIHIMDHLYELHQLNKHHLKSIIRQF